MLILLLLTAILSQQLLHHGVPQLHQVRLANEEFPTSHVPSGQQQSATSLHIYPDDL